MTTRAQRVLAVWPLVLAAIAAAILFRAWYLTAGYLTYGDLSVVLPESLRDAFPLPSLWLGNYRFGEPYPVFYAFTTAFAWLYRLGVTYPLAERLLFFWFFPPLLLAGGYLVLRSLVFSPLAAAAGAALLLFNAELLTSAIGGHTNATNAVALALWVFFGCVQLARNPRWAWVLLVFVASALQATYDVRWSPPTFVLGIVLVLVVRTGAPWVRAGFAGAAVLLGALVANAHWLVPRLFGIAVTIAPPNGNTDAAGIAASSPISFLDALALWNPYFVNVYAHPPLLYDHVPIAIAVALLALALGALIVAYRERLAWFALALYLVGAFLTKGASDPLGGVYVWAFVNVPIFNAYRDPSKFAFVTTFGFVLLVAVAIAVLARRQVWRAHLAAAVVLAAFAAATAHAFDPAIEGVLVSRPFPAAYTALNTRLRDDTTWGRVLWLPQLPRWAAWTKTHPAVDGVDLGRNEFLNFTPGHGRDRRLLDFVRSPLFPWLAQRTGLRYIAIASDYYEDATISGLGDSVVDLLGAVRALPQYQEIATDGPVHLFRARFPIAHAEGADGATLASGGLSPLQSAALFPDTLAAPPLVLGADLPVLFSGGWGSGFDRLVAVDPAAQPYTGDGLPHADLADRVQVNVPTAQRDRIVAAPSTWEGPDYGNALIRALGPGPGTFDVRFARGAPTLAMPYVAVDRDIVLAPPPAFQPAQLLQEQLRAVRLVVGHRPLDPAASIHGTGAFTLENALPGMLQAELTGSCTGGPVSVFADGHDVNHGGSALRASFEAPPGGSTIGIVTSGTCSNLHLGGTLVAAGAETGVWTASSRFTVIPLVRRPSITVVPLSIDARRERSLLLVRLRAPDGTRYIAPAGELGHLLPNGKQEETKPVSVDVRAAVYDALVSSEAPLPPLAREDAFDRLALDGLDVVDLSPRTGLEPRTFRVHVTTGSAAPAQHVTVLAAARFAAPLAQRTPYTGGATLAFPRAPGPLRVGQLTGAVVSGFQNAEEGGAVLWSSGALTAVQGFAGGPLTLSPERLANVYTRPGGAFTITDRPLRQGSIALDISSAEREVKVWQDAELRIGSTTFHVFAQIAQPEPQPAPPTIARLRVDVGELLALAGGTGADAELRSLRVFVTGEPQNAGPLIVAVGDAYLLGAPGPSAPVEPRVTVAGTPLQPGRGAVPAGEVRSQFGASSAVVAVDFRTGGALPRRSEPLAVDDDGFGRKRIVVQGHPRWLVLRDRYDGGWRLDGPNGSVSAVHLVVDGSLNGWFDPNGLAPGTYVARYAPDPYVRVSAALGFAAFVLLVLALAYALRRGVAIAPPVVAADAPVAPVRERRTPPAWFRLPRLARR